tara:strand:+ start:532 stop:2169 length:1638 start_codon:yes stop_codon:yes gene_type:complete
MGILSGVLSSFVIALINERVSSIDDPVKMIAVIFISVACLSLIAELVSRLALLRLSTKAVRKMRLKLCDQILNASLRNVEKQGSGKLMAALTEDIHAITEALVQFPVQCIHLAIVVGCFSYLYYLSWELATTFLVIFALGVFIYDLIARRTRPLMEQGRTKWDELITHYNGLIDGNKELKIHAARRHGFSEKELKPTALEMMELSWRWNKIFSYAESSGQMIYYILIGFALFVAPFYGHFEASVLTGFVLMVLFMSSPISSIVGSFPTFHRADISLERIQELGLSFDEDDEKDIDAIDVAPTDKGEAFTGLAMKGFSYQYESDTKEEEGFTLGPLNFEMKAGELIFVVGGNGSGKSSFARLLAGLYAQDKGQLILNGKEITPTEKDEYRQNFSVVFSDYYLFKTFYGMMTDELQQKSEFYLEKLQLSNKVSLLEDSLSTVDLSQGQRKRLALLTAFIEDRDIFLFDEWAADQDPEFKAFFYYEILPELKAKGKTVVVISHDDHYFEVADRVVRFSEGKIIEDVAVEDFKITFSHRMNSVTEVTTS